MVKSTGSSSGSILGQTSQLLLLLLSLPISSLWDKLTLPYFLVIFNSTKAGKRNASCYLRPRFGYQVCPPRELTYCRLGPWVVILIWESLETLGSKTSSRLLGQAFESHAWPSTFHLPVSQLPWSEQLKHILHCSTLPQAQNLRGKDSVWDILKQWDKVYFLKLFPWVFWSQLQ